MDNIFKKNLKQIRIELGKTQDEFAKPLGIKGKTISALELGTSNPSNSVLELIELKYLINREWLQTGEGEKHLRKEEASIYKVHDEVVAGASEEDREYDLHGGWKPRPEMKGEDYNLIGKVYEILKSGTPYSIALAANINAFHSALNSETRLKQMENKIEALEKRISVISERKNDRIRGNDPPEKKEDLIKMRGT